MTKAFLTLCMLCLIAVVYCSNKTVIVDGINSGVFKNEKFSVVFGGINGGNFYKKRDLEAHKNKRLTIGKLYGGINGGDFHESVLIGRINTGDFDKKRDLEAHKNKRTNIV